MNGVLAGAPGLDKLQTPGEYPLHWQSLKGTAYLTRAESANPVCGGRDLSAAYADEYDPLSVTVRGRSADLPSLDRPPNEARRGDGDIVLDTVSAEQRDDEIILTVKGYFFGQCGVEPQVRVWEDTDIMRVTIYRVIPPDAVCTGGTEAFALVLPYIEQDNLFKNGDRAWVNVNGQIIAILIGL